MAIPKIRKDFKSISRETANAILFKDFDGKEFWVPKSICTLVKQKKDMVVATLAVFKFEEITGIHVEDMAESFVSMGGKPLAEHIISEKLELVESKTKPLFPKQRETLADFHLQTRFHALFWEAGTGKTICSLTLANTYYMNALSDIVVILCPAHLKEQWKKAAAESFPELPVQIYSTQSASFDKSLMKFIEKFAEIKGKKHLIIDESHLIKNQSAKRTKNIFRFVKSEFTTICTATPIGKNASDLYFQFAMMDKRIIGEENYGGFEKKFLLLGGIDGEKVVALQNTKELSDRISPYISFLTKKDIREDMPEKKYRKIFFEMNDRQKRAINYIQGLVSQIQSKTKTGYIPKEKSYQIFSFLQKIASGYIPNEEEMEHIFANLGTFGEMASNVAKIKDIGYETNNNRLEALQEFFKENSEPAIIWCKYLDEVKELVKVLPKSRAMYGEISLKERWKMTNDFNAGKFRYLIASLQLGNGLDFPEINLCINYTTTFDYINRTQLEDRTDRIISTKQTTVIDFVAKTSIDERIHQVLDYKHDIATIFNGKRNSNSSR